VIQGFALVLKLWRILFSLLPPDRTSHFGADFRHSQAIDFVGNSFCVVSVEYLDSSGDCAPAQIWRRCPLEQKSLWVGFQRGRLTRYAERDKRTLDHPR
jgi:hypothetical protein